MKKIAILGCGNGGQALAGHLSLNGHIVSLYAHENHLGGLRAIQQQNGVELIGEIEGFTQINLLSTNLQECVENAEIILMALPALACDEIFLAMMPYLQSGQIIVNMAGYFSSIFAHQALINSPYEQNIIFAELTSFPYACRAELGNKVNIVAIKDFVGIAAIPANKTTQVIEQLQTVIPCPLMAKNSVLEVGLYNTSGIGHTPAVLFNAARIGNKDEFYFYKDGISEETANVMIRLDQERISIGSKLGYTIPEHYQVLNDYYGYDYTSIYEYYKKSPIHNSIKFFPTSTKTRYILEDVPYILVPWYSIAQNLGIEAKGIKNLIEFTSLLHNTDYMQQGRKFTPEILKYYT